MSDRIAARYIQPTTALFSLGVLLLPRVEVPTPGPPCNARGRARSSAISLVFYTRTRSLAQSLQSSNYHTRAVGLDDVVSARAHKDDDDDDDTKRQLSGFNV